MESNEKIIAIKADIITIYNQVASIEVTDEASFLQGSELRNTIKKRKKRVDELRKEAIAPFKAEVDRYNNMFKIEEENLESLLKKVDTKLIHYADIQEKQAREAQRIQDAAYAETQRLAYVELEAKRKQAQESQDAKEKQRLEEEAKNIEIEQSMQISEKVQAPKVTVRSETGTMSIKKIWTFDIYDLGLLLKTHPEFFIPDTVKINEYVKTIKEEKTEDGLRIYQKTSLASR